MGTLRRLRRDWRQAGPGQLQGCKSQQGAPAACGCLDGGFLGRGTATSELCQLGLALFFVGVKQVLSRQEIEGQDGVCLRRRPGNGLPQSLSAAVRSSVLVNLAAQRRCAGTPRLSTGHPFVVVSQAQAHHQVPVPRGKQVRLAKEGHICLSMFALQLCLTRAGRPRNNSICWTPFAQHHNSSHLLLLLPACS